LDPTLASAGDFRAYSELDDGEDNKFESSPAFTEEMTV
jgi:hypothetical protein